jgi:hypothetical protein
MAEGLVQAYGLYLLHASAVCKGASRRLKHGHSSMLSLLLIKMDMVEPRERMSCISCDFIVSVPCYARSGLCRQRRRIFSSFVTSFLLANQVLVKREEP